jgi:hypothetical protein
MASVYTNDLRLEEIGSGEQSGTWGDTTNTNLELIAEAFAFGTEAITTNADTHATTIADGATDPGRALFLKYTGTLDSACTITLGPNTVSKLWFIENGTSGSQNIIISQGSGANITIPPGDTKAIYSDGAGSGAAMVDAFASLSVVDLKVQDDLTVTGTTTLTGDLLLGDNDKAIFGAGSDLQIYHDGSHSYVSDQGTGNIKYRAASRHQFENADGSKMYIQLVGDTVGQEYVQLRYNNSTKLATTNTGIDVTGTVTADGLTVDGAVVFNEASADVDFRVESNGNANMLFVDGGENRIGIGTNAPATDVHIQKSSATAILRLHRTGATNAANAALGQLEFFNADGTGDGPNVTSKIVGSTFTSTGAGGNLEFYTHDSSESGGEGSDPVQRVKIDGNGNVGIGTSSPTSPLHLYGSSNQLITVESTDANANIAFKDNSTTNVAQVGVKTDDMFFATGGSEAMRIDSSGNLLVGNTSTGLTSDGVNLHGDGTLEVRRNLSTANSSTVGFISRGSSDGNILQFYKDTTHVGSIGVRSGTDPYFVSPEGSGTGLKMEGGLNAVVPISTNGEDRDNVVDLGKSTGRFDDIYATNGTIQTSDRNEKQDIASLTSAEMLVAKRISALFKTFRWKDKVAAKGNDARTHTGIIAQDVQAAFTAEGLDAGDYSLFISSTWWEHDVEVPAVEAVAEVTEDVVIAAVQEELDEEGNVLVEAQEERTEQRVITEAVEAVDAYTRTDTYDTLDEAPEGATSKTRMGIRYPELLSFVAAYNEQRFAAIETRLTALEG